jgi:hypothetical protein
VIIGRDADLFSAWEKWGQSTYAGEVTYKGKKVDKITGKFTALGRSPSGVRYEILLSKTSDLLSYIETETYPAEISGGRREITVTYSYEIAVVVNPVLKVNVFDPALHLGKSKIKF